MTHTWTTDWSGGYPCLCAGEWTLFKDGVKVDVEIPFANEPAYTHGTYQGWSFGEDYLEEFYDYQDGADEAEWIAENRDYLESVTKDENQYPLIFKAYQANDWRYGSCGGCI